MSASITPAWVAPGPCWLVHNSRSGSFSQDLVAAVAAALARAGYSVSGQSDCATDDLPDGADLEGCALLVLLGGDGTINSAIRQVGGWGGAVLPLPGGTANLLCHALYGDATCEEIVDALAAGRLAPRPRAKISVAGHTALIEIVVGTGALWADAREEMREGNLIATLARGLEAASESISGSQVRIVSGARDPQRSFAAVRLVPEPSAMRIYTYHASELGEFVRHGLAVLSRRFREGPYEEQPPAQEVTCRSAHGSALEVMIDGERATLGREETFRLEPLDIILLGLNRA